MEKTIQIIKTLVKENVKNPFDSYKFNCEGKRVDLRFRKDSEKLDVIPYGMSRIVVEGLEESKTSFYPRYYCTFKRVQPRDESTEMTIDEETGEIKE